MKNKALIPLLMILITLSCSQNQNHSTTTSISLANDSLYLGMLMKDAKKQGKFTFTNTNADSICILDVKSSCGCVVPKYTKKNLYINEIGEIDFQITAPKISGKFAEILVAKFDKPPFLKTFYIIGEVEN